MKQDTVNRAHRLLTAREPDWSLEQPFHVERDFFDMGMDAFFTRQWLFAARTCEIPASGDWIRIDIAREAGIEPGTSCGSGLCGTCLVRKQTGEVVMQHRGSVSEEEIADGFILADARAHSPMLRSTHREQVNAPAHNRPMRRPMR